MYITSEYYKNAVMNSNPSYLTGTITFQDGSSREISDSDIALGGASITMQSVTQDVLEFGAAVLGQLDISIRTDKDESRYKYYDSIIELHFSIDTENGTETIPLGKWIVSEAEKDKTALKLCAYDNLFKLEKKYSLTLVGTPYELITTLVSDCECELAENEDYYKSLPNGQMTLTITAGSSCSTYRQAVSIIAQMCGCFAQADRYGKITLRRFSTTETFTLSMAKRYRSTIADYICQYIDIEVSGLAGSYSSVTDENAKGLTMYLEDAPAWDEGTEDTLQAKVDNLMAYLRDIIYTPCEILMISDPTVDCGDYIVLETENGSVNTLVTSYTWKYHAQMEIQSVGKNPYLIGRNASTQRIIRDLEKNGGVGGGSPSELYIFKNTRKFNCSTELAQLATVTFVASEETFVLFNATFQVDVEVLDNVETTSLTVLNSDGSKSTYNIPYNRDGYVDITIQYYYNSIEYGMPYTARLGNGSHIITLHYPISGVEGNTIDRFAVYMSANGGKVSVAKEAFVGTISGEGLAGKPKWDGTITVEEYIGETYPIIPIEALGYNAEVSFKKYDPRLNNFTEQFNAIDIMSVNALGFEVEAGVNRVVTNYTFNTNKHSSYDFDRNTVLVDESYKLMTSYEFVSSEYPIDSGSVATVKIMTSDKTTIESVVINDEL